MLNTNKRTLAEHQLLLAKLQWPACRVGLKMNAARLRCLLRLWFAANQSPGSADTHLHTTTYGVLLAAKLSQPAQSRQSRTHIALDKLMLPKSYVHNSMLLIQLSA